MSNGLFETKKGAVELFGMCENLQRLFHRQMVGEGIEGLFTAIMEAQRKTVILSNDILLNYQGDYTSKERKALELALSEIGSHLISCMSSVELFGMVVTLTEAGAETLNKYNDAIAKANDFTELSKLLKQMRT